MQIQHAHTRTRMLLDRRLKHPLGFVMLSRAQEHRMDTVLWMAQVLGHQAKVQFMQG